MIGSFTKRFCLSLIMLLCIAGQAFAGGVGNTYYASVTANHTPTGAGTVYVENGDNNWTGTTTGGGGVGSARGNVTVAINATPAEGYEFYRWVWATGSNTGTIANANSASTSVTVQASNTARQTNARPYTIQAEFRELPKFYFSATALVSSSGGGTASVTPATKTGYGQNAGSTSATTTFAFSASPTTGYEFVGWSETDGGAIVSSANPYDAPATSTSKNSGSPTNTTLYANFERTEGTITDVGYVFFTGTNYLNNAAAGTTTFDPATCIWTGNSGGAFTNGTYYIRNNNTVLNNYYNRATCTLGGTESGTTGRTLYLGSGTNYLRYNNGWSRGNDGNRNVVFAVQKKAVTANTVEPTISGEDVFTDLTSKTYTKTNASHKAGYNDYIFYNGTHHYFTEDDSRSLAGIPTSETFTYRWSLSDEAAGHVTVNPTTGEVSYNTLFEDNTTVTLILTATSTTTSTVLTAQKDITFLVPMKNPTAIAASDIDYIMVGGNQTITPTLSCEIVGYPKIYTNISYTSKNPSIATVNASTGQVTGVAAGTAVVTISAALQGGGSITRDINVIVKDNCVAPTITFSNATNELTMTTTTPNSKIYYTIDGNDPTLSSSVYDPAHKPVLNTAETVKAITISNDAAHYINSHITTLNVAKVATPTVSINGEQVVIACTTPGVTLHYTTDGSTPTAASPITSGTIDGLAIGTNVKVIAVKEGMINSNVATKVVKYNVPHPELTFNGTEVTMTCPLDGAKIYYTTNGNNPTTGSTLYNPEAKPTFTEPTTVKAIAVKDGYDNSATTSLEIVRTATPIITVSGTSVNLSCATPGVTYYYTTDGSEPTSASASTTGTTLNDTQVPPGSTLKVMTVGNNLLPSIVTSKEVNFELTAPVINIDGGNVTMTGPAGATIHYTTNGSEPTESSPVYTAPFAATNGMTYKAIAMKAGYTPSDITTEKYMIATGVANGVVTLNDYEDHTWTYYAGVPTHVDGGHYNDAYRATGTGTRRNVRLYSPNPRNLKITYTATEGAAVSIDESETSFVYYETLEEGETSGQYPYQVISSPFSKRPSGKGFGGWEIVSGGDYIDNHVDGDVLEVDENIIFIDLPYSGVNSTSATIQFRTTWVDATIKYGGENISSQDFAGGNYETNILVVNADYTTNMAPTYPVTIMMVEPDGSTDYRSRTFSSSITPVNGAGNMTKLEFANWTPGSAINPQGRNFIIGRGMRMNGTRRALYGSGSQAAMNQVLKVESGNFSTFTSYNANPSSVTKHWVTFGNDYDRAKRDNAKLTFTGKFLTGQGRNLGLNSTGEMARVWSKSGSFLTNLAVSNAAADNSYYIGVSNTHNNGHRYLEIQGGEWYGSIAGGMGENHTPTEPGFTFRMKGGRVRGSVYGAAQYAGAGGTRTYILTGGEINGWVAAGANGTQSDGGKNDGASYVYVGGNAVVDSKHSATAINRSVGGNVYGAGCGYSATSNSGEMTLGSNMVVADNAYIERGLYGGGGFGFVTNTQTSYLYITGGHVGGYTGQDYGNTQIQGGVYGGARQNKGGSAFIYMTGGLVETGIYGGSNNSGTMNGSVTMQINGGQVGTSTTPGNIHGGGYGQNTVINQNVDITLGKMGVARNADGVTVWGDVYGGSALGSVNGTAASNSKHTNVTMNAGYIHGSLYGGALGSSTVAANVYGPVQVKVYGGSVFNTDGTGANGSGAVYGANNINGAPQRSVTVDIYGTNSAPAEGEYALFSVYGGGNQANYTYGNGYPTVTVHNCDNSIEYVYGGGNAAAVAATDVTIYGGDKIGNVFGGGNGQVTAANVNGGTNVKIYGGTIGDVYGGSNTQGTIGGTISVNVNAQADPSTGSGTVACPIKIDNVYGGGNKAASAAGNVTIGCAEHIGAVYGGANQANVTGDITLNIVSGHIDNVFGGNNNSGNISGNITVNVNDNGSACGMEVGNVYGGGNLAKYGSGSNYPVVNINNGHLTGSVFGGGKGETAVVTGNPQVTIGQPSAGTVHIDGNVFGGGDAADVEGSPVVLVQNCSTMIGTKTDGIWNALGGTVYGGGNAAHVTGAGNGTSVTINGGDINRVFGGGNGEVSPANVEGDAQTVIHAGNINQAFAGSNMQGKISGTADITVDKNGSCELHIVDVFGGGNQAAGSAGTVTINCTGSEGEGVQNVYGGANNADVTSDITLVIKGGTYSNVFGGNNVGGVISGTITVNIEENNCSQIHINNLYGGGNMAPYGGVPTVNVLSWTSIANVFGGGFGSTASVGGSVVKVDPTMDKVVAGAPDHHAGAIGSVFGGGNAAPVNGSTSVLVKGGTATGQKIVVGGHNTYPDGHVPVLDGFIFGGGNQAPVNQVSGSETTTGNTSVTVTGFTDVKKNVYGGGNGGAVGGNTHVVIE